MPFISNPTLFSHARRKLGTFDDRLLASSSSVASPQFETSDCLPQETVSFLPSTTTRFRWRLKGWEDVKARWV
jgi:hypothetical protein